MIAAFLVASAVQLAASAPASRPALEVGPEIEISDTLKSRILQHSPLPPLPPDPTNRVADDPAAARLGQYLFFEPRLSRDGRISCATCHDPTASFSDGKPLGKGVAATDRNTPALWNVAYNRWFFWDGRSDSLWSQVLQPIEDPREMNSSRLGVAHVIAGDAEMRSAYEAIFGQLPPLDDLSRFPPGGRPFPADAPPYPEAAAWRKMTLTDQDAVNRILANVGKAIAAFERKLISRDSPFDRFARALRDGDSRAMAEYPPDALRGARIFMEKGSCRLCHAGPNFTDNEFHTVRVRPLGGGEPIDPSRRRGIERLLADAFNAGGAYSDDVKSPAAERLEFLVARADFWGAFKTPSLRNVARTAPYMHQGQFRDLDAVIEHYSTFRDSLPRDHHSVRETVLQPLNLSVEAKRDLRAFLESLTDESIDPALRKKPESPRSR
jgi:cytochrome c peroxidase